MSDEPARDGAPYNLFTPVPGDHGADGRFGALASASSPAFWASKHRGGLLAGGLALAALAAVALTARRAEPEPASR